MANTRARNKKLKDFSEKLAEGEEPKKREKFKSDYMSLMTDLNDKIDVRLAEFEKDAAAVAGLVGPLAPAVTADILKEHTDTIKSVNNQVMALVGQVRHRGMRVLLLCAIRDVVSLCCDATLKNQVLADLRNPEDVEPAN